VIARRVEILEKGGGCTALFYLVNRKASAIGFRMATFPFEFCGSLDALAFVSRSGRRVGR